MPQKTQFSYWHGFGSSMQMLTPDSDFVSAQIINQIEANKGLINEICVAYAIGSVTIDIASHTVGSIAQWISGWR